MSSAVNKYFVNFSENKPYMPLVIAFLGAVFSSFCTKYVFFEKNKLFLKKVLILLNKCDKITWYENKSRALS